MRLNYAFVCVVLSYGCVYGFPRGNVDYLDSGFHTLDKDILEIDELETADGRIIRSYLIEDEEYLDFMCWKHGRGSFYNDSSSPTDTIPASCSYQQVIRRNSRDCSKYTVCASSYKDGIKNFILYSCQCQKSDIFSTQQNTCERAENVKDCTYANEDKANKPVPTSMSESDNYRIPQVQKSNIGIGTSKNYNGIGQKTPELNSECLYMGKFMLQGYCDRYIHCTTGSDGELEAHVLICPRGQHYSKNYRICMHPFLARCPYIHDFTTSADYSPIFYPTQNTFSNKIITTRAPYRPSKPFSGFSQNGNQNYGFTNNNKKFKHPGLESKPVTQVLAENTELQRRKHPVENGSAITIITTTPKPEPRHTTAMPTKFTTTTGIYAPIVAPDIKPTTTAHDESIKLSPEDQPGQVMEHNQISPMDKQPLENGEKTSTVPLYSIPVVSTGNEQPTQDHHKKVEENSAPTISNHQVPGNNSTAHLVYNPQNSQPWLNNGDDAIPYNDKDSTNERNHPLYDRLPQTLFEGDQSQVNHTKFFPLFDNVSPEIKDKQAFPLHEQEHSVDDFAFKPEPELPEKYVTDRPPDVVPDNVPKYDKFQHDYHNSENVYKDDNTTPEDFNDTPPLYDAQTQVPENFTSEQFPTNNQEELPHHASQLINNDRRKPSKQDDISQNNHNHTPEEYSLDHHFKHNKEDYDILRTHSILQPPTYDVTDDENYYTHKFSNDKHHGENANYGDTDQDGVHSEQFPVLKDKLLEPYKEGALPSKDQDLPPKLNYHKDKVYYNEEPPRYDHLKEAFNPEIQSSFNHHMKPFDAELPSGTFVDPLTYINEDFESQQDDEISELWEEDPIFLNREFPDFDEYDDDESKPWNHNNDNSKPEFSSVYFDSVMPTNQHHQLSNSDDDDIQPTQQPIYNKTLTPSHTPVYTEEENSTQESFTKVNEPPKLSHTYTLDQPFIPEPAFTEGESIQQGNIVLHSRTHYGTEVSHPAGSHKYSTSEHDTFIQDGHSAQTPPEADYTHDTMPADADLHKPFGTSASEIKMNENHGSAHANVPELNPYPGRNTSGELAQQEDAPPNKSASVSLIPHKEPDDVRQKPLQTNPVYLKDQQAQMETVHVKEKPLKIEPVHFKNEPASPELQYTNQKPHVPEPIFSDHWIPSGEHKDAKDKSYQPSHTEKTLQEPELRESYEKPSLQKSEMHPPSDVYLEKSPTNERAHMNDHPERENLYSNQKPHQPDTAYERKKPLGREPEYLDEKPPQYEAENFHQKILEQEPEYLDEKPPELVPVYVDENPPHEGSVYLNDKPLEHKPEYMNQKPPPPVLEYIEEKPPQSEPEYVNDKPPQFKSEYANEKIPQHEPEYVNEKPPQNEPEYINEKPPQYEHKYINEKPPKHELEYIHEKPPHYESEYVNEKPPKYEAEYFNEKFPEYDSIYFDEKLPEYEAENLNEKLPEYEAEFFNEKLPEYDLIYFKEKPHLSEPENKNEKPPHHEPEYINEKPPHHEPEYISGKPHTYEPEYTNDKSPHHEPEYINEEPPHLEPEYRNEKPTHHEPEYISGKPSHPEPEYINEEPPHPEPEYMNEKLPHHEPKHINEKPTHHEPEYINEEPPHHEPEYINEKPPHYEPEYINEEPPHLKPEYRKGKPPHSEPEYINEEPPHHEPKYIHEKPPHPEPEYIHEKPPHPEPEYINEEPPHPEPEYISEEPPHPEPEYINEEPLHHEPEYISDKPHPYEPEYINEKPPHLEPEYRNEKPTHHEPEYISGKPSHPEPEYITEEPPHHEPKHINEKPPHPEPEYINKKPPHPEPEYINEKPPHHESEYINEKPPEYSSIYLHYEFPETVPLYLEENLYQTENSYSHRPPQQIDASYLIQNAPEPEVVYLDEIALGTDRTDVDNEPPPKEIAYLDEKALSIEPTYIPEYTPLKQEPSKEKPLQKETEYSTNDPISIPPNFEKSPQHVAVYLDGKPPEKLSEPPSAKSREFPPTDFSPHPPNQGLSYENKMKPEQELVNYTDTNSNKQKAPIHEPYNVTEVPADHKSLYLNEKPPKPGLKPTHEKSSEQESEYSKEKLSELPPVYSAIKPQPKEPQHDIEKRPLHELQYQNKNPVEYELQYESQIPAQHEQHFNKENRSLYDNVKPPRRGSSYETEKPSQLKYQYKNNEPPQREPQYENKKPPQREPQYETMKLSQLEPQYEATKPPQRVRQYENEALPTHEPQYDNITPPQPESKHQVETLSQIKPVYENEKPPQSKSQQEIEKPPQLEPQYKIEKPPQKEPRNNNERPPQPEHPYKYVKPPQQETQFENKKPPQLEIQYESEKPPQLETQHENDKPPQGEPQYEIEMPPQLRPRYKNDKLPPLKPKYENKKLPHLKPENESAEPPHLEPQYENEKPPHLEAQYKNEKHTQREPQYEQEMPPKNEPQYGNVKPPQQDNYYTGKPPQQKPFEFKYDNEKPPEHEFKYNTEKPPQHEIVDLIDILDQPDMYEQTPEHDSSYSFETTSDHVPKYNSEASSLPQPINATEVDPEGINEQSNTNQSLRTSEVVYTNETPLQQASHANGLATARERWNRNNDSVIVNWEEKPSTPTQAIVLPRTHTEHEYGNIHDFDKSESAFSTDDLPVSTTIPTIAKAPVQASSSPQPLYIQTLSPHAPVDSHDAPPKLESKSPKYNHSPIEPLQTINGTPTQDHGVSGEKTFKTGPPFTKDELQSVAKKGKPPASEPAKLDEKLKKEPLFANDPLPHRNHEQTTPVFAATENKAPSNNTVYQVLTPRARKPANANDKMVRKPLKSKDETPRIEPMYTKDVPPTRYSSESINFGRQPLIHERAKSVYENGKSINQRQDFTYTDEQPPMREKPVYNNGKPPSHWYYKSKPSQLKPATATYNIQAYKKKNDHFVNIPWKDVPPVYVKNAATGTREFRDNYAPGKNNGQSRTIDRGHPETEYKQDEFPHSNNQKGKKCKNPKHEYKNSESPKNSRDRFDYTEANPKFNMQHKLTNHDDQVPEHDEPFSNEKLHAPFDYVEEEPPNLKDLYIPTKVTNSKNNKDGIIVPENKSDRGSEFNPEIKQGTMPIKSRNHKYQNQDSEAHHTQYDHHNENLMQESKLTYDTLEAIREKDQLDYEQFKHGVSDHKKDLLIPHSDKIPLDHMHEAFSIPPELRSRADADNILPDHHFEIPEGSHTSPDFGSEEEWDQSKK